VDGDIRFPLNVNGYPDPSTALEFRNGADNEKAIKDLEKLRKGGEIGWTFLIKMNLLIRWNIPRLHVGGECLLVAPRSRSERLTNFSVKISYCLGRAVVYFPAGIL